jgi:ABC-2 type transport system permease protein
MSKIWDITLHDLRLFLTSRGNLVSLILIPVIMTLIVGLFSGGDGELTQVRMDIIDNDDSELSAEFVDTLRAVNESLVLCPMDNNEEDICELGDRNVFDVEWAVSRVEEATVLAMLEIPEGFGASVQAFQPVTMVYRSKGDLTAPAFIRQAVEAAIQRVNGAAVASRVGSGVLDGLNVFSLDADERSEFQRKVYERAVVLWDENPAEVRYQLSDQVEVDTTTSLQDGLGQSVPGMGSMFVMFTVFGGMTALVMERQQWTLQRLASMPISRTQLLGGKILARFVLGLVQYLVVFAVGVAASLYFGADLLALFLIALSYTLAITAFSFAVGTRIENPAQASGLSLLLSITLAPLGGAWWPMEVVPDFMRVIGHVSPVAWAMDGYHSLIFQNGDLSTVWVSIVVLLGLALVFFILGIWRFKYT